jgi:2-dehydro-3-deoxygluconokinase
MERAIAAADMIYVSGITLAILPAERRPVVLNALEAARANGKSIAFDPNLRPRLWSNASEMTETIMLASGVSDIVLPSYDDEAHWFGDANPDETADRYLEAGVSTVVLKNGDAPVLFAEPHRRGLVPVTPVYSGCSSAVQLSANDGRSRLHPALHTDPTGYRSA